MCECKFNTCIKQQVKLQFLYVLIFMFVVSKQST
jgi:hypothetical protein